MKLYATIRSERAMKGQGGNQYLNIDILGEKKEPLGYIKIIPDGTNYRLTFSFALYGSKKIYIPKF